MGQRDELGMRVNYTNNGLRGVHAVGQGVGEMRWAEGQQVWVWRSMWWGTGDELGMGTCIAWDSYTSNGV